jgi:hypothetical protein
MSLLFYHDTAQAVNKKEEEPNSSRRSALPYHYNNMKKTI